MKETNPSPEIRDRINDWMFVLLMRLYNQNIYSDESYVWKVYDSDTIEQVDNYFENVLTDFKNNSQYISHLKRQIQKKEDIKGR